jgi:hypothetical protein
LFMTRDFSRLHASAESCDRIKLNRTGDHLEARKVCGHPCARAEQARLFVSVITLNRKWANPWMEPMSKYKKQETRNKSVKYPFIF